ncbi:phosphatidylinositol-specific phospholipase C [Streptomyces sp. Z26]|uniref:phosphatidylinositol-specific phospholipase C n=1 Tax=Streptomyces sp. Z26 TaxID=2500177 RepID=UPI000EF13B96|nr:phosphatidylinositol-specific phospholipase C [Streptomyces sp. Z26]RLL66662.1 phosphatidylinositol-specific phospholipase C domain-containing protein [Streptomyces sp. Z26]
MRDTFANSGDQRVSRRGVLRGAAGAALGLAAGGTLLANGASAAPRRPAARAAFAAEPHNWMSGLPDDRTIDDLTIPGTHNSCATVGGPFDTAKCQDLSLPDLLSGGVRFLDIRCRPIDGAFAIHHGVIYQNKNFNNVLTECRDFLSANPGETVLMSVKKEHSDASAEEFAAIFNDLYMKEQGFDSLVHRDSDALPSLGAVRGKVVLVAREPGIGGIDRNGPLLSVQDDYQLPVAEKWDRVQEHLDAAKSEAGGTKRLSVNYVSTTTGELLPAPRNYAKELNPKVETRLNEEYDRGDRPVYGAILLDFAGSEAADLPKAIYRLNEGL